MPEYLHPGVYIEETSYRGKPIEGVSTSTAGFVGRTQKGREGEPSLITSFTQFVRDFGAPFPAPADLGEHLGHAVRGFFDNGGSRVYVVRVLGAGADAATSTSASNAAHGLIARLPANGNVLDGATTIRLQSLRGIDTGSTLRIFTRGSASSPFAQVPLAAPTDFAVTSYNTVDSTVTLDNPPGALDWNHTYVEVVGTSPESSNAAGKRPIFTASYRGEAGNGLAVRFSPQDRPLIRLAQTVAAADTVIPVANTGGLYPGALVELDNGTEKRVHTVDAVDAEADPKTVTLVAAVGIDIAVPAPPALGDGYIRTLEFKVEVIEDGTVVEAHEGLAFNASSAADSFPRYYINRINDPDTGSNFVTVAAPADPISQVLGDQPTTADGLALALSGGLAGSPLVAGDLVGSDGGPGARRGIEALKERTDISIVAVPGVTEEAVQAALITHSELMKYRVAVLDAPQGHGRTNDLESHRNAYDTTHAAYYAPWLQTLELSSGRTIEVPPSGHVAGIYARTDNTRGVFKAPANETLRNITGLKFNFTDGQQDVLNPQGINLIREFPGRGTRVWGARCLTSDQEWKYLNVRRLFAFLEASIDRGTQWVVFEPNSAALWDRVTRTIESFLFTQWSSGALMGSTTKEAYFVRCDRSTMTQDDIDNGRLVCLIGIAPVKPAEFVIFRIGQFTANESN